MSDKLTEDEADDIVRRFEADDIKTTMDILAAFNHISPHPIVMRSEPAGFEYKGRYLKIRPADLFAAIDIEEVGMRAGYSTKE